MRIDSLFEMPFGKITVNVTVKISFFFLSRKQLKEILLTSFGLIHNQCERLESRTNTKLVRRYAIWYNGISKAT